MNAMRDFFGTDKPKGGVVAKSSRFPGTERRFERFSDVIDEIVVLTHLGRDPLPDGGRAGRLARQEGRELDVEPRAQAGARPLRFD